MSTPVTQQVTTVLDSEDVGRAITRISHEIVERPHGAREVVILGIPTRGDVIAQRLAEHISAITGRPQAVGQIDTTLYRDDLARHPMRTPHPSRIPSGGIDGKIVILVDDVLYTGRTVKAALDAVFDIGRPASLHLAILVDRGHRELPIRPDYVGKNLPTSRTETVVISVEEIDGEDAVRIHKLNEDRQASSPVASDSGEVSAR